MSFNQQLRNFLLARASSKSLGKSSHHHMQDHLMEAIQLGKETQMSCR